MNVVNVLSSPSPELPAATNASTGPDAGGGFFEELARQRSSARERAASSQASPDAAQAGTAASGATASEAAAPDATAPGPDTPVAAVPESTDSASEVTSEAARDKDAAAPVAAPATAAWSSPLADMVRELTARSRAVAADSLERSNAQGHSVAPGLAGPALRQAPAAMASAEHAEGMADSELPVDRAEGLVSGLGEAAGQPAGLAAASGLSGIHAWGDGARRFSVAAGVQQGLGNRLRDAAMPVVPGAALRRSEASASSQAHTAGSSGVVLQSDRGAQASARQAEARRDGQLPGLQARASELPAGQSSHGNVQLAGGTPAASFDQALAAAVASASAGDVQAPMNPVSMLAPAMAGAPSGLAAQQPLLAGSIPVPLGAPHWGAAFSEQMVQIGTQQGGTLHHAELRLDPPDLGPLRVSISLQGEQATASFVSSHASVRAAVEAALPELTQALANAGISLGNTSVSEQEAREFAEAGNQGRGHGGDGDADGEQPLAQAVATTRPRGLVDTFA